MTVTDKRNRIASVATFAVLVTGFIIGLAIAFPLFNHMQRLVLDNGIQKSEVRVQAFANNFLRYQDISGQIAGNRESARLLDEFLRGNINQEKFDSLSRPRLSDAIRQFNDLALLIRYDTAAREIMRVGPLQNRLPTDIPFSQGLDFFSYPSIEEHDKRVLMTLSAPVLSPTGDLIGHDMVFFNTTVMESLWVNEPDFSPDTNICLVNTMHDKGVVHDAKSQRLVLSPADDCLEGVTLNEFSHKVQVFNYRTELGVMKVTFFKPLDNLDWNVRIRTEASVLYGELREEIMYAELSLLVLMLVTSLVARRMISPMLRQLVQQAEQIEHATAELRLSATVFENSQDAILITDPDSKIIRANAGFTRLLGFTSDSLTGTMLQRLVDADRSKDNLLEYVTQRLMVDEAWQGEIWYHHANGQIVPVLQTISPVRDEAGNLVHLIYMFNDMSDRLKAEQHLERLAHYDKLTALPNRNSLEKHLAQSIIHSAQKNHSFALMFLDLNKFKPVNDTLGHEFGDLLLQRVAQRLQNAIRATDIVGRQGGDEFLLITSELEHEGDAAVIAEKVAATLCKPFELQNHVVEIGVSIGIAIYPQDGSTAEQLLQQADRAMYKAKELKDGHHVFASLNA